MVGAAAVSAPISFSPPSFSDFLAYINHLEVPIRRSKLLLNPEWDGTETEWPYPSLRLCLRWQYPWWISSGGFCVRCSEEHLDQQVSATSSMGIHFYGDRSYDKPPSELVGMATGVNAVTSDVIFSGDIVEQEVEAAEWQGFQSARFEFVIDLEYQTTQREYRVSRMIVDPERKGTWLVIAISALSLEEAEATFNRLEEAITLD